MEAVRQPSMCVAAHLLSETKPTRSLQVFASMVGLDSRKVSNHAFPDQRPPLGKFEFVDFYELNRTELRKLCEFCGKKYGNSKGRPGCLVGPLESAVPWLLSFAAN